MTDPSIRAITARFEASREAYRAARDEFQEQQTAQLADLDKRKAGARQDQAVWMRAFAETKAAEAKGQAEAEQQNRWPERDKKNLVHSFREDDERPAAPPPRPVPPSPAPPRPAPAPQPPAAERPRERRVLSFDDDEEQPPPPTPKPIPKLQPSTSDSSDRPGKGRVLSFSTEDDEDEGEGFQGFRGRR